MAVFVAQRNTAPESDVEDKGGRGRTGSDNGRIDGRGSVADLPSPSYLPCPSIDEWDYCARR
ncbi:hypothetical protein BRC68_10025 [Halobacteriales archaeon QH_6_64_20]|nr:MAG: hypothetical protein BRC68_10025 [Halobacteriales archaeon QH_6_64_20]